MRAGEERRNSPGSGEQVPRYVAITGTCPGRALTSEGLPESARITSSISMNTNLDIRIVSLHFLSGFVAGGSDNPHCPSSPQFSASPDLRHYRRSGTPAGLAPKGLVSKSSFQLWRQINLEAFSQMEQGGSEVSCSQHWNHFST